MKEFKDRIVIGYIVKTEISTHVGVRLPKGMDKNSEESSKLMNEALFAASACYDEILAGAHCVQSASIRRKRV